MAEHPRQVQGELSWQFSCQRSDTLTATDGRSVADEYVVRQHGRRSCDVNAGSTTLTTVFFMSVPYGVCN